MRLTLLWVLSLVSIVSLELRLVSTGLINLTVINLLPSVGVPLLQTTGKCRAHRQTPWTYYRPTIVRMIPVSTGTTPLPLFVVVVPFFSAIGSDRMWLLQDKDPVVDQTTQPKQWTKQVLQQSGINRHVVRDTGRLVGIFSIERLPL